jgi:Holliday junction resolvase RusA-like endonuclease
MYELRFEIQGTPQPRGSKIASLVHTKGGYAMKNGKPIVVARDDNKKSRPWMDGIHWQIKCDLGPRWEPLDEPVELYLNFYFSRPKGHYRSGKYSNVLRDDAPFLHGTKPDLDKLERAVLDALTGVVYVDDSRVASLYASKRYTTGTEGVVIEVKYLGDGLSNRS